MDRSTFLPLQHTATLIFSVDWGQGKDNAEGRMPPNSRRQEDDNQREDMGDGRICVGPCDCEMTDPKDVQGEAELTPPRRRFDGWRVALFGAFIVAIGGSYDGGVPPIPEAMLGGSQDAYVDGGGSLLLVATLKCAKVASWN